MRENGSTHCILKTCQPVADDPLLRRGRLDPERAVLTDLAILENIEPLRDRLKREEGIEFNVRVGLYGLSRRYHHLAMKLAQEQEHPLGLGWVHVALAAHNSWLGLPGTALEHGAEAAHFFREAGLHRGRGRPTS